MDENATVQSFGSLTVLGAVEGNVSVRPNGSLTVFGTAGAGPGPASRTSVKGDVKVERSGSLTIVGSATARARIGGKIQTEKARSINMNGGGDAQTPGIVVEGSVILKETTGPSLAATSFVCSHTRIDGNLEIVESGPGAPFDIGWSSSCGGPNPGNVIRGNVKVEENRAPVRIANNVIRGNLTCKENKPPALDGGNTVRGDDRC